MDRWQGKVAVITGASSGIGAATVIALVKAGMVVAGLARRQERIEELKNQLPENLREKLHAVKCDVSKEDEILVSFKWIEENLGGVDVLVNNAGIFRKTELMAENNSDFIRDVIDTNLTGLVFCTREAFKSMKKRNVDGHIIHVSSILGHYIPLFAGKMPSFNIYPATKHAVTALTEVMRQEFIDEKVKTKITSISPGLVATEMTEDMKDFTDMSILNPEDISDAIIYVLGTPPHVQVHELTIKPVGEMF